MKSLFQCAWVQIWVEFFPARPAIRRYRVLQAAAENATSRRLDRRIARQVRDVRRRSAR